jgi:hypothetical protein
MEDNFKERWNDFTTRWFELNLKAKNLQQATFFQLVTFACETRTAQGVLWRASEAARETGDLQRENQYMDEYKALQRVECQINYEAVRRDALKQ